VQFFDRPSLTALVVAFHKAVQRGLPIALVAAGLPQLPKLIGEARSYAERLFDWPVIGSLADEDARLAVRGPAERAGVHYAPAAVDRIVQYTEGYPYFIQEMGSFVWRTAPMSPITLKDAEEAIPGLEAHLDEHFFRARAARTTELELAYLRAMAELPNGPKASGDIAQMLGYAGSDQVGATRAQLINKGLIFTPGQGLADFTVPQFDRYMKRNYALTKRTPRVRTSRTQA
jgi:hypothetical protein